MAINKNNKNFQITLDPVSAKLLETLAIRFKTSKSIIIRNALNVYAGKKVHIVRMTYSTLLEVEQTEQKPSSKKVIETEDPEEPEYLPLPENEKNFFWDK